MSNFPFTYAHSASPYPQISPDTTALVTMADSNKRKAGNDTAGGAAFKKKKVSRGAPCPRLNMAPQYAGLMSGQSRLNVPWRARLTMSTEGQQWQMESAEGRCVRQAQGQYYRAGRYGHLGDLPHARQGKGREGDGTSVRRGP